MLEKISALRRAKIDHKKYTFICRIKKYWILTLMLLPGFISILIFCYGPMYGLQIAFRDYNIVDGVWGSPWVGFKYFENFFQDQGAFRAIRNTVIISIYKLIWGFPMPIILALLFNEIKDGVFKRCAQTVSYLPHFISWVILGGMITELLSPRTGIVRYIANIFQVEIPLIMSSTKWFRTLLVVSGIWQEIGWNSVIYLAAISGINVELYQAALIDGANRIQRMRYITLPSIVPTITTLLVLRMAYILNANFDQVFNLYNASVFSVADIIDTYVYRVGLLGMQYSFNTSIGLFKSLVGLIMVILVNWLVKRINSDAEGIW